MAEDKNKRGVSKITIYKISDYFDTIKVLKNYDKPTNGSGKLDGWDYQIFIRSKKDAIPSWMPLLDDIVDRSEVPRNAYSSLVILFSKDKHHFGLTAGYGYVDIQEHSVADFGIDIACKALDRNQLNYLHQKTPIGNVSSLSRTLRGKYIPVSDTVNRRSVLKSLRGKTINKKLGAALEGKRSLIISGKKRFQDVISVLDGIVDIEKSGKVQVSIRGLKEVSEDTQKELDKILIEKINEGKFNDALFGYDDDLIFKYCEKLKLHKEDKFYSIDEVKDIMGAARRLKPNNAAFIKITGYDDQNSRILEKNLIDIVEGELDFKNDKYFRIDKRWYKTNEGYQKQIETDFRSIERIESNYFKPWHKESGRFVSENIFLKANTDADKIMVHTQRVFHHIEFADIIDKSKCYFVYVKKGRGAFLRNLFAQGHVTGSLFHGDDAFRKEVKNKFNIDTQKKYTIVFAIFPEYEKKVDSIFTLFAKVDLLERYNYLQSIGFNVKYCLINSS